MAELDVAEIEITQPLPERGFSDTTYKIEGAVKLAGVIGAPPWIYAEAKLKSWLRPEIFEETTYGRGFPIPVTGRFTIGWTPKKEGAYEVTVVATPAPLPLPIIGVPPIIGKSDVMEFTATLAIWQLVEEIADIVVEAGPGVSVWLLVEEIADIVVAPGPEVSVWLLVGEVPGIIIGAGPEVSLWLLVGEVSGIVVAPGPEVSVWLLVGEVAGIVVGIEAPPAQYTLEVTIEPPGTGSVTISPSKATYSPGETVTLTATPYSGYEFDHWGGWPPYPARGSTSPSIQITMDEDKWVVAAFRGVAYTLEVTVEPPATGYVTISPRRPTYSPEEIVTLTAYPYSGYEFDHWGGWPPYPARGSASPSIQITMDEDKWVVAAFHKIGAPPPPPLYPYVCWVCGEGFYDEWDLIKHVEREHPEAVTWRITP